MLVMEVLLIKLMVIIRLSMGINDTKQDIGDVSNANVNQVNGNGTTIINNNGISVVDAYNILPCCCREREFNKQVQNYEMFL